MRRWRVPAAFGTLALAGTVATLALAAQEPAAPPSIELDAGGPLFSLQGMAPGDPPTERCIALTARDGTATRLEVSGTVAGPLAQRLRMEVSGGRSPPPGAGHACTGFAAEQTLWSGTLAQFPAEGAPAVSEGQLAEGQSRTFRFRVWLPADATVRVNEEAHQTILWRAELDAPAEESGTTTAEQPPPAPAPEPQPTPAPSPAPSPDDGARTPEQTAPFGAQRCTGAAARTRRCRGRLIVRVTPGGARLHARVHAPGDAQIRSLSLRLPATLPGGRARVVVLRSRLRNGSVLELTGRVRTSATGTGTVTRQLTLTRLPRATRTVLLRLRLDAPAATRGAYVRAGCRRAPVAVRLTTSGGARSLTARTYVTRSNCRG